MKKQKTISKSSKLFISLTSVVSILSFGAIIGTSIALDKSNYASNGNKLNSNENSIINTDDKLNNLNDVDKNNNDIKPLIVNETNYFNPRLSSKNGPILFWKEEIISADWFGAERWRLDISTLRENDKELFVAPAGSWNRKWLNFDLDKKKDILYVLSNGGSNNQQVVVAIDVASGRHIKTYRTLSKTNSHNDRYFGLSVLENGNVLVYCKQGNVITKSDLIDIVNDNVISNQGNLSTISSKPTHGTKYLMNFIPIANNRNLAVTYNLTSRPGTTDDNGREDEETSQVEFLLCDDNMNVVESANNEWKKPKIATKAITGTRNSAIWPQRDWYKLLDGRVVTVIYDKLIIIDGSNADNPSFTTYTLDNDKWIESWSFDTNEKLYFKSKNNSIIQTVTLDPNKGNNHNKSTYYDLNNSKEQIKKYANNFTLFNVYGYSGQIMLINPFFNKYINVSSNYPTNDEMEKNQYGLAAAITNNKSNSGQGDTKGLLNTKDAFQKSADFSIRDEILKNKLPSEISRTDLILENQSFFTKRNEIENGKLKYNPFIKTKMDDDKKELEVTVNLDQIPWFVTNNEMPNDIKPLTLKKSFSSIVEISSRFTWKKSNVDDYDFKNTLPSKVTLDDIKRISPLVSTLSSQNVLIEGERYPKVDYKISDKNDDTGNIKIIATYSYLPIDTPLEKSNIKTYITENTYTIFKSTDIRKFSFVNENNSTNAGNSNINNIPALKELKEANLFPTYFENLDNKQEFLKFIDINETKGYPLEKMNISVEANDDLGTLKVIVDPTNYDNQLQKQSITYTGLNKKSLYKFSFDPNPNNFDKREYRASEITDEIIFEYFINYSGFDSSDLKLSFNHNDELGNLIVDILVNVKYPDSIFKMTGFENKNGIYSQTKTISGFKTNNEFNNEYQLNFKNDLDKSLIKIKEFTPATIKASLESSNGLNINGVIYKDLYSLISLFILSKGSNIPNIENNSNISINMFVNNSGGEITFEITFNSLSGYANQITFIQKFTGFAKGNDDITNDVLTFKDSNQLKITEIELLKKRPSEIKNMFSNKNKKEMLNKFLSGVPTGDYKKAIDNNKFELELIDDDNFGTLTINIKFKREDINNIKSLLEYSQTFTGFNYFN